MLAILALGVVAISMIGEAVVSRRNEQALRQLGAREAPGDVYCIMSVAYPACFVAIAAEGALAGRPSATLLGAGAAVFLAAKALKYWAVAALGRRWTFRVLVLPEMPLVASGPYRWVRHPNYMAVVGEMAGMAMALDAPVSGVACTLGFGALMWRRVRIEERALGIR